MNETDLFSALDRATDAVESPDLARTALAMARVQRTRRRGALAAGVAGAAVAVVLVVTSVTAGEPRTEPPAGTPSPSLLVPLDPPASAPSIDPTVVAPVWDPGQLSSLSPRTDLALPTVLDPPFDAPLLAEAPVSAVVAAIDAGGWLGLASSDQTWRRLEYPDRPLDVAWAGETTALSPDGTRIGFTGEQGIWWRDVREGGTWRRVDYPFGTSAEWDVRFEFSGTEEVRISGPSRSFGIDLGDGRAEELPFDLYNTATSYGTSVHIYVDELAQRRVDEWWDRSQLRRSTTIDALDSLTRPATDGHSLAAARGGGTGGSGPDPATWDGLLVLDLDGLTTRGLLPIRDQSSYYSDNGFLGALAWVDEDTVLGIVVPRGKDWASGTQHLFTWNVETGEVSRVSTLGAELRPVLATDLLRDP